MVKLKKTGYKQVKIEIPGVTPADFTVDLLELRGSRLRECKKKGVRRFYSLEVLYDGCDGTFIHVADVRALLWLYDKMKLEDKQTSKSKYGYRFYSHEITARKDEETGDMNAVDVLTVGRPERRTTGKVEFKRRITTAYTY